MTGRARPKPAVSVIVPSYHDRAGLLQTLAALEAQTLPAARFEVLVVDNSPGFELDGLRGRLANLKVLHEPRPGSYAARNHGVAHARGEVLAFTDADCKPAPDWLERAIAAVTDGATVAGHIDVVPRDPGRPNAVEAYEMAYAFPQRHSVERLGYGVTANLVVARRVFDEVGLFRDDLRSGGDRDWCHRLRAAGLPLSYRADVVVRHPARRTFADLGGKVRRHLGGKLDLHAGRRGRRLRFLGGVLYAMAAAWGGMGALLVRGRLRSASAVLGAFALAAYLDAVMAAEAVRLLAGGSRRR